MWHHVTRFIFPVVFHSYIQQFEFNHWLVCRLNASLNIQLWVGSHYCITNIDIYLNSTWGMCCKVLVCVAHSDALFHFISLRLLIYKISVNSINSLSSHSLNRKLQHQNSCLFIFPVSRNFLFSITLYHCVPMWNYFTFLLQLWLFIINWPNKVPESNWNCIKY